MGDKTSYALNPPIQVTLWGTQHVKEFTRLSDVAEWGQLQSQAWADVAPTIHPANQAWNDNRAYGSHVTNAANALALLLEKPEAERQVHEQQQIAATEQSLRQRVGASQSGEVLSTDHPHFGLIQAIAETDPNAAAILLAASLSNPHHRVAQSNSLDSIARVGAAAASLDQARKRTISTLRAELADLRRKAEQNIESWRATIDEHDQATKANIKEHQRAVAERNEQWGELLGRMGTEWDELKRVYDEKLALLAPTEYWRTRSATHKEKAKDYAIAFGISVLVFIALFFILVVSYLDSPGTTPVVLVVLPVVVPVFAGIWVLRILGRLLSENLAISQDAAERETMVKTFLSLMRDETTGKSLVTDEDRRIILHALFRQSTVTATDDSPPMHWLQALKPNKP